MSFLDGWPAWRRHALGLAGGVVAALGLAPLGLWVATLAALLLLPALLISAADARQAAWSLWAFGLGYFGYGLMWIVEPFLVDSQRHGWMAPFALVLTAGGMAVFWAVAGWFAVRAARSRSGRVWLLVCALALAEFARAYVLTGFPWGGFSQIWVGTDVALLLAYAGPHGLNIATLAIALPPGLVLARGLGGFALLASAVPVAALGLAALIANDRAPLVETSPHTVRLIQPNAPQHQKWDPDHVPVFFRRQIDFTRAGARPDLIVWPETSVPYWLEDAGPALDAIVEAAAGSAVVLGIQRADGNRMFNSLIHLDGSGNLAGIYDKHHLVPFGEYVPLGGWLARLGVGGLAAGAGQGFSAGPGPVLLPLGRIGTAVPLICYEAVFPQDVAGAPGRPNVLLQITNDAWFGSHSGPYQHLAQARMRAVEQGLPMIRAANTGISAMIDPLGNITDQLPLNEAGYVDAVLPAPLAPTPYSRTGDLPVLLVLLAATLALARLPSLASDDK